VTISNDTVKTNLVKVWSLELQHLKNTSTVDLVCSIVDLLLGAVSTTEAGADELLAVLVEQVESWKVTASGDLDQLCEAVSDLGLWESAQEAEVKESVHWGVVSTETVLVIAVVDSDLDGDGSVNETNDGGWNTDVVGVAAVGSTGESGTS